jgi:hypothetical protein
MEDRIEEIGDLA